MRGEQAAVGRGKLNQLIACLFLVVLCTVPRAFAQTSVKGTVTDAETREPLPFVNVYFKGTTTGVVTDLDGKYSIKSEQTYSALQFSYLGYKTITRQIPLGNAVLHVRLNTESKMLDEVTVRPGKVKEKYRNKNNPAVDLVKAMIDHRENNRLESYDYAEYEQYEKLLVSLINAPDKFKQGRLLRKYQFLLDNMDTTTLEGKALLPIYLQENLSDQYYKRVPEKRRTIKKGHQKVSFEDYIDNQGLSNYLNYLYNDIDIYDNNVTLLTNQFLSPIADLAPSFYKFYLTDTLRNATPPLAELTFVPRNPADFLFQGKLYVTLDSNYAVQKLDMRVNKNINLNWVRELHIAQDFEKLENGRYRLAKSKMRADFGVAKRWRALWGADGVVQKICRQQRTAARLL
jgi:CarboxypepD_reg-like domain/Family of unknown function (DUF5686)